MTRPPGAGMEFGDLFHLRAFNFPD
jgi:hypothetical protein